MVVVLLNMKKAVITDPDTPYDNTAEGLFDIPNIFYDLNDFNIRPDAAPSRLFLSKERALGSAVKLLTPSDQYSDEYNQFLKDIPENIRTLAFFVKRHYRGNEEKGLKWKDLFNVEIVNVDQEKCCVINTIQLP